MLCEQKLLEKKKRNKKQKLVHWITHDLEFLFSHHSIRATITWPTNISNCTDLFFFVFAK